MRRSRLKLLDQPAHYHVICRITQGQLWLGAGEKAYLTRLLYRVAKYCGVEVLTFCVMSNHFHLLVSIPAKAAADARLAPEQVIQRVQLLHGNEAAGQLRGLLGAGVAAAADPLLEAALAIHVGRMHDLSIFMKLLKQRFTMWHNHEHGTRGTLWTERFKSVLVESRAGKGNPLTIVAGYIDLNPVRAGVVTEAKDYPYSGVGCAASGDEEGQRGLMALTQRKVWADALGDYEAFLQGTPDSDQVNPDAATTKALRSRQAALVRGAIIGSATFVLEVLTGLMNLRRNVGPMIYAAGPMGNDLWVGARFRKS